MVVSEIYECPKCHRSVKLEGPNKQTILAHFQAHVRDCPGVPSTPMPMTRSFHARPGNGRKGILNRLFKRPTPPRTISPMPSNAAGMGLAQMLAELEAVDEAYMAELHPPPAEITESAEDEIITPAPIQEMSSPASTVDGKGHQYLLQGFNFDQKSAILNFREFQKVREEFLLQSRVIALTQLYSVFFLSFVDYHYGYGMDDHKKHNWILGMSEIREDLEQLKGRAQQGIWDPDYEGIIELNLNIKFEAMVAAHTMDTKSARETDKHERLLEMAKAMIAQGEEKQELRNLMDEVEGKTEGAP